MKPLQNLIEPGDIEKIFFKIQVTI